MPFRRAAFRTIRLVTVAAASLLAVEMALRITGRPRGRFEGIFATSTGLWPPGFEGWIRSGPVPYRVSVDSHGFRGPELRTGVAAAETRVVCIGDSFTDGFYVDDEDTYPAQVRRALADAGFDVEVVSAARGGGSMPRFLTILRNVVLPLAPDVVLVTFVYNDLEEMGRHRPTVPSHGSGDSLAARFVTETALGEAALGLLLWLRSGDHPAPAVSDEYVAAEERYAIEGNEDYEGNAHTFLRRFARADALLLEPELHAPLRERLEAWRALFAEFAASCRAAGAEPVLLHVPPYPLLYLEDLPDTTRTLLADAARELDVPFLDPTDALREASREGPVHLAPLDFHLNPRGNRAVGVFVAHELRRLGLVPGDPR